MLIDIFSAFLKPVILQLNLDFAHSRFAKRPSQYFKYLCTFNIIFYLSLNTVSLSHISNSNTTTLNNPKWLILSTYMADRRINLTEKNAKIEI